VVYAQPPKNFTHGDILRWRRVGGLTLAEVQYEPGLHVRRHIHAHARFVLVLAGAIT
jgi:quercetin dioxygenase-like cupin family protein